MLPTADCWSMLRNSKTPARPFTATRPPCPVSGLRLRHVCMRPPSAASPDTLQQVAADTAVAAAVIDQQRHVQEQQKSQPDVQQQDQAFNWHNVWYPVAIMSQLDDNRPTAVQLLGIPMVIWKDGQGHWIVFEDKCPHRLAPLSEGRLDPRRNLMCSYHGWQFDSTGKCTSIPQIGETAAHQTACNSKKSCAIRYPAQVAQGLLWVWPEASSAALAAATSPALTPQWQADGWTMLGGEWFMRDLEYGYDTLLENLFDPSHIPFAHHGIMGTATRDKAQPLNIVTKLDVSPTGGFQLTRDSAPFRTAAPTDTVNNFVPPVLNSSIQTNTVKGTSLLLTFYGIPVAPGKSRVITAFFTTAKVPKLAMRLASAFEWVFHLGQNQVLDSDAMLLHVQERLLHEGKDPNWRSAFFLPAGADLGIIKFRQWYTDCAGGSVPFSGALQHQGLGPVQPREQVMDRYHQHVIHCKSCQAAVRAIQRWQAVTLGLAAVAAAAAVAMATAAAASSSVASTAAGSGVVGAVVGTLAAVPTWQVCVSAAVAVVMLIGHKMLSQLQQRFFFIDYIHADRK